MSTLRELEAAATKRPWRAKPYMIGRHQEGADVWAGDSVVTWAGREGLDPACSTADAALISAARNALPLLLDVVDAARLVLSALDAQERDLGPVSDFLGLGTISNLIDLRTALTALDAP